MKGPACYCGSNTVLRRSSYGPFWGCERWPECDGLVGCHPGSTTPLGTPADQATRSARRTAHEAFDALWAEAGSSARSAAYRWLAETLGLTEDECHMAHMDIETCEAVIAAVEQMEPEALEAYR